MAYGAESLLHLHGTPLILLVSLIVLAGIAAAVAILVIHFRAKKRKDLGEMQPVTAEGMNSTFYSSDANRKLTDRTTSRAKIARWAATSLRLGGGRLG